MQMNVYSVNKDKNNLLLVNDKYVINGNFNLIERNGVLCTPHTFLPVELECKVIPIMDKHGFVDYNLTLNKVKL